MRPNRDASVPRSNRGRAWAAAIVSAVLLGILGSGVMVWRSVDVTSIARSSARQQFEDVRSHFRGAPALIRRDESGRFVRTESSGRTGPPPANLFVLAYHAADERLVRVDVPIWLFTVKGPAAALALRGTGFDLDVLGLTAGDLRRSGSGLILDETGRGGDALLAWTR